MICAKEEKVMHVVLVKGQRTGGVLCQEENKIGFPSRRRYLQNVTPGYSYTAFFRYESVNRLSAAFVWARMGSPTS